MNKKQESNCACCQVVDFSKDGFKHLMRHAVFEREAKIDICKTNLILNFRPNEGEYPEFARINAMLVEADRVIVTQKQTKRLINELIETQGIGLFVDRACLGLKQKKRIAPLSYVWGEIELMPLGGTYRHSTNWIMLNKVKLDLRSGEKTMAVTFCDSQTCYLLPTSPQIYFENKKNCRYIYEKEHQVIGEVLNAFNLNKTIEIYEKFCQTEFNEEDNPIAALKQGSRKLLTDSILKMLFNEEEITEMLFADVMNGISSRYDKLNS